MNIQTRLSRLEERMTRRVASVHPLHGFMAAAAGNPEIGDAMDALADRLYPVFPDEAPVDAPDEQVQFDHLQSLLDEIGVAL